MHGGPPAALLGRAFEQLMGPDMLVGRVTVEFMRPLAIGEYRLDTQVVRPGKKIRIVSGSLSSGGTEIVRASALAIRRLDMDLGGAVAAPSEYIPASPEASEPWEFPFFQTDVGYHTAMELRVARGRFGTGALTAWMRMRYPLLPDEEPSGLQRTLAAADSGNGLSVVLDYNRTTFVNPDLTVCLHRHPVGPWVCLDAVTYPEPSGVGLARSALFDVRGPIGIAAQTLILETRT